VTTEAEKAVVVALAAVARACKQLLAEDWFRATVDTGPSRWDRKKWARSH